MHPKFKLARRVAAGPGIVHAGWRLPWARVEVRQTTQNFKGIDIGFYICVQGGSWGRPGACWPAALDKELGYPQLLDALKRDGGRKLDASLRARVLNMLG